jgi:hypothetical protein
MSGTDEGKGLFDADGWRAGTAQSEYGAAQSKRGADAGGTSRAGCDRMSWWRHANGAWRQTQSNALNARWAHGHPLGAGQALLISRPGPSLAGSDEKRRGFVVTRQKNFFRPVARDTFAGQFLPGGVLGGLRDMAEFARCAAVEGFGQRAGGGHHARKFLKHLRPSDDLHDVPDRTIGAEPGAEQAGNGNLTPHALRFCFWYGAAIENFRRALLLGSDRPKLARLSQAAQR